MVSQLFQAWCSEANIICSGYSSVLIAESFMWLDPFIWAPLPFPGLEPASLTAQLPLQSSGEVTSSHRTYNSSPAHLSGLPPNPLPSCLFSSANCRVGALGPCLAKTPPKANNDSTESEGRNQTIPKVFEDCFLIFEYLNRVKIALFLFL